MIGTDSWMYAPPRARQGVPHGQTETGGIVLAVICLLGPERPKTVLLDRALYFPTSCHFLIVNKTSLLYPAGPAPVTEILETKGRLVRQR